MDRLPALIILALSLGACGKSDQPDLPSRAEGAKVAAGQKPTTDAFCDFHKTDDSGPLLQIPPVGEVKVTSKPGTWTWLNIWATWCKPCIEEMPRISKWRDKLLLKGKEVNLQFVSLDDNEAAETADKLVRALQTLGSTGALTSALVGRAAQEQRFLVFAQGLIGDRIGVGEPEAELVGQQAPQGQRLNRILIGAPAPFPERNLVI